MSSNQKSAETFIVFTEAVMDFKELANQVHQLTDQTAARHGCQSITILIDEFGAYQARWSQGIDINRFLGILFRLMTNVDFATKSKDQQPTQPPEEDESGANGDNPQI